MPPDRIQQRDGRWVIVDLVGKGGRVRTVPMPSWAKAAIDAWTSAAGIDAGRIFRAINKGDRVTGESMTAQAVFETVRCYAREIGVERGQRRAQRRALCRELPTRYNHHSWARAKKQRR